VRTALLRVEGPRLSITETWPTACVRSSGPASSSSITIPQLTIWTNFLVQLQNGLTAVLSSAGLICAQGLVIRSFDPILVGIRRNHRGRRSTPRLPTKGDPACSKYQQYRAKTAEYGVNLAAIQRIVSAKYEQGIAFNRQPLCRDFVLGHYRKRRDLGSEWTRARNVAAGLSQPELSPVSYRADRFAEGTRKWKSLFSQLTRQSPRGD